jgi:hypothetical protein
MKSRKAVTITLSQAAIDALSVLSANDHRNRSQEIEYLILERINELAKNAQSTEDRIVYLGSQNGHKTLV